MIFINMKKIILKTRRGILFRSSLLFMLLFLSGCVKEYDTVVDPPEINFRVTYVGVADSVKYVPGDSVTFIRLGLTNPSSINSVHVNIYSSENKKLNNVPVLLKDNGDLTVGDYIQGDSIYSGKFPLSQFYPNGNYRVEYFVEDKYSTTTPVAVKMFTYDNAQSNLPPVVSNLLAPDSAAIGSQAVVLLLTLDVYDPNGLNDIELVYYNSFIPPNGTPALANPIQMFDDGLILEHGDSVAGDGTYSRLVILPSTGVTTGIYRWEFQARDRGKKQSNVIIHNIKIY